MVMADGLTVFGEGSPYSMRKPETVKLLLARLRRSPGEEVVFGRYASAQSAQGTAFRLRHREPWRGLPLSFRVSGPTVYVRFDPEGAAVFRSEGSVHKVDVSVLSAADVMEFARCVSEGVDWVIPDRAYYEAVKE